MAIKIAEYTFNSSTDTLPTFNNGFVPAIKTESRTIYVTMMESTFNIPITSLNDIISIEIPRYEGNAGYQKKVESNSDYIKVEYVLSTSGPYIRIDSTGKCTVGCSEPWDTNENIVIKYKNGSGYIYTDVNNGNGTTTRTITSDTLPSSISFSDKTGLVSLSYLDTSNINATGGMFYNCTSLTSLDLSSFDTSNVETMSSMFHNCTNLTSINLSYFDTSKVTNMTSMFYNCTSLISLDLSSFDTSNVDYTTWMFYGCNNLTSIYMSNSNVDSINDVIGYLPARSSSSYGTITVSKDVLNSVNKTTANSKYWNVVKVPEYTFTLDTLKYLLTNIKNKFVTKEELNNKVDKVEGKQLSANNFSDEDINNINNSFDDAEVIDNVSSELTTLKFYSGNNETKTIDLDI